MSSELATSRGAGSGADARRAAATAVDEVNLVCMSGQGSVQTLDLMAKAFFEQHSKYVGSVVFPGTRSKSTPVVSYLKVSDKPITSTATNFEPGVVVVYWDGLMRVAAKNAHQVVHDAIFRLKRGVLIHDPSARGDRCALRVRDGGTVDASGIARKHLKRYPAGGHHPAGRLHRGHRALDRTWSCDWFSIAFTALWARAMHAAARGT